jgi:hypothetical protein
MPAKQRLRLIANAHEFYEYTCGTDCSSLCNGSLHLASLKVQQLHSSNAEEKACPADSVKFGRAKHLVAIVCFSSPLRQLCCFV